MLGKKLIPTQEGSRQSLNKLFDMAYLLLIGTILVGK
jgi:hypothetical protein